jgi:hypothetical protein
MNYSADVEVLRNGPVTDPNLRFAAAVVPAPEMLAV